MINSIKTIFLTASIGYREIDIAAKKLNISINSFVEKAITEELVKMNL